jgi:serine/threonine protein kinase
MPLLIQERYRLIKPIQKRSSSKYFEVFEAEDLLSEYKIIKVLQSTQQELVHIFRREAQVLSWLDHPGIPAVEPEGFFLFPSEDEPIFHCLVMEKIKGQTLESWCKENQLISPDLILRWLKELIQILNLIHKNNFSHGDIKPSNIIRKPNGQVALIDFGAVKQSLGVLYKSEEPTILTPGYASPEQFDRQAVPQSDFYALGRTFVHLLTKQHPIDLEKGDQLIWRQHLPSNFPTLLADLVDTLMAPKVAERPCNANEALQHIDQVFHSLLASSAPELSESIIVPNSKQKQTEAKPTPYWQSRKILILLIVSLSTFVWLLFFSKSKFVDHFKYPVTYSKSILLPDEAHLETWEKIQVIERGKILAVANFYPKTDTFIVDDTAKDSRRAYVEYRIPTTGVRGVCEDADGATSPLQSCDLNFRKNLDIYWRLCVRDADGPKPTVCTGVRRSQT